MLKKSHQKIKLWDLKNKKIAIVGFWKEGQSTLSFLEKNSCKNITIHDKNPDCSNKSYPLVSGHHYLKNLESYDLIFLSPGISRYNCELIQVEEKITTQAQVFFDSYKSEVIAVTGTKGKSTTTSLIYKLLKNAWYRAKLVGNIGNPVLEEIDILDTSIQYDFIIYELSSYMLEGLRKHNFLSVLLNIYPDHLDWHHGFENYKNAKLSILAWSTHKLVWSQVSEEDSWKNTQKFWYNGKYYYKSTYFYKEDIAIFDDSGIKLLWEHNRYNICAVVWVCDILEIDTKILESTLRDFSPLSHRLENVGSYHWITFIDDAISTTPESTIEAIKTFWKDIDTIFLWGSDRWYDYKKLVEILEQYQIYNIVLFPISGKKINSLLWNNFTIFETESMQDAVGFAYEKTAEWRICLLSTAAPSYSLWRNFEEKGDRYQKYIKSFIK